MESLLVCEVLVVNHDTTVRGVVHRQGKILRSGGSAGGGAGRAVVARGLDVGREDTVGKAA
jgi:hypothetical protein